MPKSNVAKMPVKQEFFSLLFNIKRDTPGTFVFEELGSNGLPADKSSLKVGSLYIRKTALGNEPPARIRVTITEA